MLFMRISIFKKAVLYCLIVLLVSSCSVVGFNFSHGTPVKPFKYPVFSQKDSLQGFLNKYRTCYDVHYYNLDVSFDIPHKEISGFVDMYFNSTTIIDTLQIDLFKNLKIDSIVFNGESLKFKRAYNAVFVKFNNQLPAFESFKITTYYHGKPDEALRPPWEGGFVWKKDKNKKPWIGVTCEVKGASSWWPVKDHLSDEPDSMKLSFTVPSGLLCVSNGHLIDSVTINNGVKYTWRVSYPINNYNATFYIGDFVHFSIPFDGIDTTFNLDFYVQKQNLEKAKLHFLQTSDILHFYEKVYEPYPWPRDGFKLVESPFEGMEHQSAIAYGSDYKMSYGMFDYIILHEAAHEWWGNSVTATDYAEVWLHEGFATYSEALFVEMLRGRARYLSYLDFYAMLIKNARPVIGPKNVNYWDYKDSDVYLKGALTLHTLRNTIKDSLFFDVLKTFYASHKYSFATTTDFVELVNVKTGKDFSPFFNQYLYTRNSPELEWSYSYSAARDTNILSYRWTNTVDDFSIPIKVKTDSRTFIIRPTKKMQHTLLPKEKTILVNTEDSYISMKHIKRSRVGVKNKE
jgi:aminopeptidase N